MLKKIAIAVVIIAIIGAIIGYQFYHKIYGENVIKTTDIYIPTGSNFDSLTKVIQPYIKNSESFAWVAEKKSYQNKIRAGKFKITEGMSNDALINHLRSGKQETVNVTFNNQDTFEKLAGRIANQIEADSLALLTVFKDAEFLKENDLNSKTAMAMYIPNSYDFYWNTSAENFRERMLKEYERFWTPERIAKAEKQNITPLQVTILASIVQKETSTVSERPMVAGLYLNRLKSFWPLQADPTIIFALKEKHGQDSIFKRVLNEDLTIDSPYNTYINFGLPPGPIGMPDISSIEAVLNPKTHDYYYMCASVTKLGEHEFAKTLSQHNVNARKYQNWINKQGINR
jgi:UPF0755 protein